MTFSGADRFAAWIPNITGYLSFSLIGRTVFPTPCKSSNALVENRRFVLCYQKRFLSDTSIPFLSDYAPIWLREFFDVVFLRKQKSPRFVLCASDVAKAGAPADQITGLIFIVDRDDWRLQGSGEESLEGSLKALQARLDGADSAAVAAEILQEAGRLLVGKAFFRCAMEVGRNGYITLQPPGEAEAGAPPTQEDGGAQGEPFQETFVRQAYYFAKDLLHMHYHHAASTDSMISVYRAGDPAIHRSIFNSLMRKVLALRRQGTAAALHRAIGFLAYAKTFNQAFLSADPYTDNVRFQELEQSLFASAELTNLDRQGGIFTRGNVMGLFASSMALAIAYASLLQIPLSSTGAQGGAAAAGYIDIAKVDAGLISIAHLALYQPISFLGYFAIVSVWLMLILAGWDALRPPRAHGSFDIGEVAWIRTTTRLLPGILPQKKAAGAILCSAMGLFAFGCWIIVKTVG